jgi:hypothetical protein
MRTLMIAIVHDGDNEQDSFNFFNEILSPLLEHVECDVHIVEETETDTIWKQEREG